MAGNVGAAFALFFGNRGFFPASLIAGARKEMSETLGRLGHKVLMLDEAATRHGAVETPAEGQVYAHFLSDHAGEFDGVIVCLPNFGDETGAVAALGDANVPILVQAYPDDLGKMAPELRRDAFCGKLSIMDVFHQYGVPFTALKPHTVSPSSDRFAEQVDYFARMCRVVGGMRKLVVGSVGARTTPFKTVRIDELALQRHGITVETFDLADIFARVRAIDTAGAGYADKSERLMGVSDWHGVPDAAKDNLVRLGVVLDELVVECGLDAVALRCWIEMQQQLGISPCVLMGEMGDRGVPVACEVDTGNAVAMSALRLAAGTPAMCLDWNNNYGDEDDKCIVFHCGPVPPSCMAGPGRITDHAILANAVGKGCGFGCNTGRIKPMDMTFASAGTEDGALKMYLGEGAITDDPVPDDFFGCAGVAEVPNLQDVLLHIGREGHRHHTSMVAGHVADPLTEALGEYLGYDISLPQLDL